MKKYKNINKGFVNANYGFLEILAQIGFMCGEMGYYPEQDSRAQSQYMINHAVRFCKLHENTDWHKTDFIIELTEFVNKFYVEWAREEVLSCNYDWDKDVVKKVQDWVDNITHANTDEIFQ